MNEVFENITVRSIAQVINEQFDLTIDGLDDVSAQHAILNQLHNILSRLTKDMKRKVFFELHKSYDLYRDCKYSIRPVDYIIALGDKALLEYLNSIKFDFNKSNNFGDCPLQTLILFNNVVKETLPAIRLLVNKYNAQVTPQITELIQELASEDDDEHDDELQHFCDQNLHVPDSPEMALS